VTEEKTLDLNCWEFHFGFLYGTLRALGASSDAIKSVDWMHANLVQATEEADANAKMDKLINGNPAPKKSAAYNSGGEFSPPYHKPTDNFDDKPSKRDKKPTSNGIAASEPPVNRLGLPDWGETADDRERQCAAESDDDELPPPVPAEKSYGWTAEKEQTIKDMLAAGRKLKEIAQAVGKEYGTLSAKITHMKKTGKL